MTKKLSRAPRQVRIIGGQWKRTPLPVPELEGLRPTPDRVRETVFNWIEHLKGGDWKRITSLDLFAGTGALGFEAAMLLRSSESAEPHARGHSSLSCAEAAIAPVW